MLGLTTKAQLTAALKRAESAEAAALRYKQSHGRVLAECGKLISENKDLSARLAAFTGPRDRKPNGRFASGKVGS